MDYTQDIYTTTTPSDEAALVFSGAVELPPNNQPAS
jgi:hypothetical protein